MWQGRQADFRSTTTTSRTGPASGVRLYEISFDGFRSYAKSNRFTNIMFDLGLKIAFFLI